jgi:hypothetical protein
MRVPFRLAATLLNDRCAVILRPEEKYSPIKCVQLSADAVPEVSSRQSAANSVHWLTGIAKPLKNLLLAKFTGQLRKSGRKLFLETDGARLRRRRQEFRPDARLYLTMRLRDFANSAAVRSEREDAFRLAIEGMRAAQLVGFLICAHVPVDGQSDRGEVKLLLQHLRAMDVDGAIVTATDSDLGAGESLRENVREAAKLIGNSWWATYSRPAEKTLNDQAAQEFLGAPHVAPRTPPSHSLTPIANPDSISEAAAVQ